METKTMNHPDDVRAAVRESYGNIARKDDDAASGCCGGTPEPATAAACCGNTVTTADYSAALGYTAADVAAVPDGSNLGLGCGNPIAAAKLQPGETVLDLGSGAGFDCFLAAQEVGPTGLVIGVDMTADMIAKARRNAAKGEYANVEFRLGEIEHLPLADASVDAVISNCVINLSPDKPQVFREVFRALKSGGRICISDVVTGTPLPEDVQRDLALHCGCLAGATLVDDLKSAMAAAGFTAISVQPKDESRSFIKDWAPGLQLEELVASALIEGVKP